MPDYCDAHKPRAKPALELEVGKLYRAKNGAIWLCYRIDKARAYQPACCILVDSGPVRPRVETFYLDGRYDDGGTREHCLVVETDPP